METVNGVLVGCFGVLTLVVLVETFRLRRYGQGLLQLGLLAGAALLLRVWIGFPGWGRGTRGHFGAGDNPWPMIGLIFACIVAGMAARYFFYLKRDFAWSSLLKPLCVSPIVLLPLVGTLQDAAKLEALQVLSFCLLAFQNGFFWRVVFERAQARLGE
jgi:CDP-diglyceride synthetase